MSERTLIIPPHSSGNGHDATYRLTMMLPKRRYFSYLRERWWVVLLSVAVAVSAMLAFETVHPDRYTSYAQIYLTGNLQLNVGSIFSEESLTYFGTQIELLKSARLQAAAFQKAGITIPPGGKNLYSIDIYQPQKTSILVIKATGPDPALTQSYLVALIDEYLAYKKETRILTSQDMLDTLNDLLAKKTDDLQTDQEKWAAFQQTNNVGALDAEAKSASAYLSQLSMELAKLQVDREMLAAGMTPVPAKSMAAAAFAITNSTAPTHAATNGLTNDLSESADLSDPSAGESRGSSTAETLKSTQMQLALKQAERARVFAEHGSVAVKGLDDTITNLMHTVTILQQQRLDEIRNELAETDRRIGILSNSIPEWENRLLSANIRLTEARKMEDTTRRDQGYYDHLLGTLQNVDLGKNVEQERLSVLQPATVAQKEPRDLTIRVALAGIGGLLVSLGFVFAWYMLDDRFVSIRDIQDQFGERILGLVPQIKVVRSKPQTALVAGADSRHVYVESFRHLRSALLLSSFGENRPQTLLFTSASPAEGKTTVAINLACLLARSGMRVVLVDADIRVKGATYLLEKESQPGVLDYLRGGVNIDTVMHSTEFENLFLVPNGTHHEQAEGLFLRPQLSTLIQELRQHADFVILDSAPILASDDTALLVPHADAIIMVARPFYTHSRLVRQALDMLYQRQARHISIVLNRARAEDLAGHYAMNGMTIPHRNGKL